MNFRMLVSSCTAAAGVFASSAQATLMYAVVDLGTLGGTSSYAAAINNHGQVVGMADSSVYGTFRATLFSGTGNDNVDLGTPGRPNPSEARDINDSGQALGYDFWLGRSILFSGTGSGNVVFGASIGASAINDRGQIVGGSGRTAALFSQDGLGITNLGTLGGRNSAAYAINEHGQVVGNARNLGDNSRATLFSGTGDDNTDLGTLGGDLSRANDINDHGQIVGSASLSSPRGSQHATLFSGTGLGNTDLGTLGGPELFSRAQAINNHGWVVGESQNGERSDRGETGLEVEAFLWRPGIGMVNLEDLVSPTAGWDFRTAVDINDFGQIAVNGCRSGVCRALRLDPFTSSVPEPGSLALLSLGLLGIGVLRPKKR